MDREVATDLICSHRNVEIRSQIGRESLEVRKQDVATHEVVEPLVGGHTANPWPTYPMIASVFGPLSTFGRCV
jgi:hypothetical protein